MALPRVANSGLPAQVYVVGDSTLDAAPGVRDLLRLGHNPFLQTFFRAVYSVLRTEIAELPSNQRTQMPRFSSIQDLVALQLHAENSLHPALHKAFVCCSHLAAFISRVGEHDDVFTQEQDVYLVGFCTGALATAAISCSRHVSDLIKIAPNAVRIAFRTALLASEIAESIEGSGISGSSSSWSITIANATEDEITKEIATFCKDKCLQMSSRPYISFVAKDLNCVTLSGPPSILTTFKEIRLAGRHERFTDLGLQAPYHAKHLFTSQDIDVIFKTSYPSSDVWSQYQARLPVISAFTGTISHARHFQDHLRSAVEDILLRPVLWENVVNGVAYISRFSSPQHAISLYGMCTTYHNHLRNSLRKLGNEVVECVHIADSQDPLLPPFPDAYRSSSGKSKIAIVGMSGRFPEADNLDAFWNILSQGLDVHKVVPASRWNAETHVDPAGRRKNTSRIPYGCWLKNPAAFDAKFFSVTPREAPQIDPASRLALMTSYEAMEMAGMVPGATPSTQKDRVGVVYGVTSNDWMEVNSAQNIDAFFIPGGCRAFIPGRVNYFFKFGGPSLSLDTACSSSMSAIHTACNLLWQGDVDTAIAGGTNVLTNPDYTAGLDRGHFLSHTGNCKPFDQSADGYCRAEGVCTVILKRLDDAMAEKDPILGVILGACTNHSAEADSITRPLADAQKDVFHKILSDTSTSPLDVGYVEMHGTGTQAGDPVEMESVADIFAPAKGSFRRGQDRLLHVGAVKSSVGHGEAAAGVTSLAKVLLMMKHDKIPPQAGIWTKLNENFPADLEHRNIRIPRRAAEWKKTGPSSRKAFINSFSAAGGNSAMLVEDAPDQPHSGQLSNDSEVIPSIQMITVSAKTPKSLQDNIKSLISYLDQHPDDNPSSNPLLLANISYTTTARRTHHLHRVAVCGSTIQQVKIELMQKILMVGGQSNHSTTPSRSTTGTSSEAVCVTFAFAGNGSQYSGMGKQLMESFPTFRADMARYDQILQRQGFRSMLPFVCGTAASTYGGSGDDSDEDDDTIVTQTATVGLEIALARLWMSWGIRPRAVVGHSLGEYAALAVAGVLSDADAIYLVARRAQLLQAMCTRGSHGMLAVRGASEDEIRKLLLTAVKKTSCKIACINGPQQVVVSGPVGELAEFKGVLPAGMAATVLRVPYAFHSTQVEPMLDELEVVCRGVVFHEPALPVISPLLARVAWSEAPQDRGPNPFSPRYLRRHCRKAVNFYGAMQNAYAAGLLDNGGRGVVLEVGPQSVIAGMIKTIFPGDNLLTITSIKQSQDAFSLICPALCSLYRLGCEVDWRQYHSAFPASHRVVQLPTYSWDLKDYWIQYVNDWSLRKGDPPLVVDPDTTNARHQVKTAPRLESISIHTVVEDTRVGDGYSIVVETDLTRQDIRPLAQGHRVNKIPLATPSIYAEIALRIGQHIADKYQPHLQTDHIMSIEDMTIEHPLVIPDNHYSNPHTHLPLILRSIVTFNPSTSTAIYHFSTLDPTTNKPKHQHSHCRLVFRDRTTCLRSLQPYITVSQSRITTLASTAELAAGASYRFSNAMIYKIVSSLAQFDAPYRQVCQIVLNSSAMDASSEIVFDGAVVDLDSSSESTGGCFFHTHPAAIDALSQSAGFIMNGNDGADLENEVFVNHGWSSFRLFEKLRAGRRYVTHCRMVESVGKRWEGDCIVLDLDDGDGDGEKGNGDGKVVAWFGGINLQGVPRRVLQYILSGESRNFGGKDAVVPQAVAPPVVKMAVIKEVEPRTSLSLATTAITPPVAAGAKDGCTVSIQQVLQILSEETGIPASELAETNSCLADLGIDSLLQILIASRLSEDMDIHIDSALLFGTSTIQELCDLVAPRPYYPGESLVSSSTPPSTSSSISGASTLNTALTSGSATKSSFTSSTPSPSGHIASKTHHSPSSASATVFDPKSADQPILQPSTASNKVTVTPRPATSIILHGRPLTDPQTLFLFPDGSGRATSYTHLAINISRPGLSIIGLNCPYARHPDDILLQPPPDGQVAVTLAGIMDAYLSEIRRRQPQGGQYHLGGWSSGGILAYLAAQLLIREGEQVESLVLIDAPPPRTSSSASGSAAGVRGKGLLDELPDRWYDHCARAKIFHQQDGRHQPEAAPKSDDNGSLLLLRHFRAQIKILQDVDSADPLPEGFTPRTSILWAGECVFDGRKPDRPLFEMLPGDLEGIEFLTRPRTDWTAGRWAELLPGGEPAVVEVMKGRDHFGMMGKQAGEALARWVERAVLAG